MSEKARDASVPAEGRLDTSQLSMHYLDWGGTGAPVIALHGLASSAHWYDLVMPHLTDSFRLVALDQRAHGETDQPSTGYDWETLAGDVAEAMDQLGMEQAAVVGHSWGANVALALAAFRPERVSRLALVEGGFFSFSRSEITWEQFKARLSPRDIYGSRERYLGALRKQFADYWSDQMERMVMSMVRIDSNGMVHERLEPGNHEQVLWAMWTQPPTVMFPKVRCPTLLVAAERPWRQANDEFIRRRNESVNAAQAALPDCTVVWISDTGHDIGYQKPKKLAQVLRGFLSEE